jgi:hypothetical protein
MHAKPSRRKVHAFRNRNSPMLRQGSFCMTCARCWRPCAKSWRSVLRCILNHTTPKADVLHRHYVGLGVADLLEPMARIQDALGGPTGDTLRYKQSS